MKEINFKVSKEVVSIKGSYDASELEKELILKAAEKMICN